MLELSLEYWNKLASQTILISSLMSGFSITVIASLLVYDSNNRFVSYIFKTATIAAGSFLVSVFASTKILMMTTKGYPVPFEQGDLLFPRIVVGLSLFLGVMSLTTFLALLGWTKSKKMGIFTTVVGFLTFLMIMLMIVG